MQAFSSGTRMRHVETPEERRGGNDLPCTYPKGYYFYHHPQSSSVINQRWRLQQYEHEQGFATQNTPGYQKAGTNAKPRDDSALIHLFKFFLYNVLYSFINLTILGFLHSVEIAFFLFSLFYSFSSYARFLCVHCASVFLLTCNLILFNTDVNWLPGSASPHGYSRQPVL